MKRPQKIRKVKKLPLRLSTSPNFRENGATVLERLYNQTRVDVVARSLLWLEDLEGIRGRSTSFLQGAFNGKLRRRIDALKTCISILSSREDETGVSTCTQVKNSDLERRIRLQAKEISQLKEKLDKSEKKIKDLSAEVQSYKSKVGSSGSSSLEPRVKTPRTNSTKTSLSNEIGEVSGKSVDVEAMSGKILDMVNDGLNKRMEAFQACEDRIVGLMEELIRVRSDLVEWRDSAASSLAPSVVGGHSLRGDSGRLEPEQGQRPLPRIISNVQVVPPGGVTSRSEGADRVTLVEVEMSDPSVVVSQSDL